MLVKARDRLLLIGSSATGHEPARRFDPTPRIGAADCRHAF